MLIIRIGMILTSKWRPFTFLVMLLLTTSLSAYQRVIPTGVFVSSCGFPFNFDTQNLVPPSGWQAQTDPDCALQGQPPSNILQQGNQGEEHLLLLKQWNELFLKIREEEKLVQNLFRDATNAQFKASQQLRTAESNKKLVESDKLAMLTEQYEKSILNLKEAKLRQKEVKKLLEKARKINSKPADITEKKLTKTRTEFNMLMTRYSPERVQHPDPVEPQPEPRPESKSQAKPQQKDKTPAQPQPETSTAKKEPASSTTKKQAAATPAPIEKPVAVVSATAENSNMEYDPEMINKRPGQSKARHYTSKPFECVFESDSIDQASGLVRQSIRPSLLFTYTDPDLRQYFKDKELITCVGRLSKIGEFIYLTIEFQIASSHSQGNFGSLQNGSLLRFKLMNDEYVSLYNLKTNEGRIDPYSGYTVFAGQYALGKEEIKKLRSSELDKMRVMWSTGFEDYDIYHLDFLINQLHCLMAKK